MSPDFPFKLGPRTFNFLKDQFFLSNLSLAALTRGLKVIFSGLKPCSYIAGCWFSTKYVIMCVLCSSLSWNTSTGSL